MVYELTTPADLLAVQNALGSTTWAMGGSSTNARLTLFTPTTGTLNSFEIYHYSDQTNAVNQTLPFAIHNYTDGVTMTLDTVGANKTLVLRQARNPASRADKASTYVGNGIFVQMERSRVSGSGNTGTGNDVLTQFDANCRLVFYGAGGPVDWSGAATTAPIQIGTYTGFLARSGYIGYDYTNNRLVIGALDSGASAFKPIAFSTTMVRPSFDNFATCGDASFRWSTVYAATGTINTSDEREKVWRGAATAAEIRAAKRIIGELGFYQWKASVEGTPEGPGRHAVEGKGKDARLHYGVRAQQVWRIMAEEKLVDPIGKDGKPGKTPYAFLCFDEWDDEVENIMEEVEVTGIVKGKAPGNIIDPKTGDAVMVETEHEVTEMQMQPTGETRVTRPAGNRYGVRPDQLTLFLIAAQEARLAALEAA